MVRDVIATGALSVDALAREAGVSRATLYAWRNGRRNPTPENLRALANAIEQRSERLRELAGELREAAGEAP